MIRGRMCLPIDCSDPADFIWDNEAETKSVKAQTTKAYELFTKQPDPTAPIKRVIAGKPAPAYVPGQPIVTLNETFVRLVNSVFKRSPVSSLGTALIRDLSRN